MRLARLLTGDQRPLASALEKCGVRSELDLLYQPTVEIYRRLPPGTATLLELEELVERVNEASSSSGLSAAELLHREEALECQAPTLSSGLNGLDKHLDGFGGRRVLEFSGNHDSGKVFLVLYLVLKHLSEHPRSSVLWIDTCGDFPLGLATEILETFDSLQKTTSDALERLQITLAFDLDSAHRTLDGLEAQVAEADARGPTFIVVNNVTSLLGPNLSAVSAQGHAVMTDFMRRLTYIARSHAKTIMVLNNSTVIKSKNPMVPREVHKPALGPSFAYLTDGTLWLERIDEGYDDEGRVTYSVHRATVLRSRNSLSRTRSTFSISRGKLLLSPPEP